ncbi:MAG: hypothetical protein AB1798_04050 [Spirochaetota bacterium]
MKKIFPFLIIFLIHPLSVFSQTDNLKTELSEAAKDMEFFSGLFPRTEGSTGEKAALDYIRKRLSSAGILFNEHTFEGTEEGHSFSRTIEVTIQGEKTDMLILAVPVNHPDDALKGEDGSINLAIALNEATHLFSKKLPISVKILFLGAEYGSERWFPMGTHQFLDTYYPEFSSIVLYINFKTITSRVIVRCGGNRIVSPYWMINRCDRSLKKAALDHLIRGNENQVFRIGIPGKPTAIEPYLKDGYPSLELEGVYSKTVSRNLEATKTWVQSFSKFIENFIEENKSGFPETWDQHYLFFQIRDFSLIIEETVYLIVLISVCSSLILYSLFFRKRISRYIKTLAKHFFALLLLFIMVFFFLTIGTFVLEILSKIRTFPSLWRHSPFLFFTLKISISFFLFFILFRFLKRHPFPRNDSFYSASALFYLIVNIVLLGIYDISLSYYSVWALIWSFFFTLGSNRLIKLACLLPAPIWLVKAVYDIFTLPALQVIEFLLLKRLNGNLILASFLLPYILMLIRLDFLFKQHGRKRQWIIVTIIYSLFGISIIGLSVYFLRFSPYSASNPQPVYATEEIDLDAGERSLVLGSTVPLGELSVLSYNFHTTINEKSLVVTQPIETYPEIFTVKQSSQRFLDRKQIRLAFGSLGLPQKVELFFSADKNILIFDSNFPFSLKPADNTATMYIGVNPPNPFYVEFTVPEDIKLDLAVTITYTNPPYPFEVTGKNITVTKKLIVHKSFTLL